MGNPYVGEIRLFGGNFAPQGWEFCEGQTLSIAEFEALFELIGTTYGGDGQTTYNLPDLRGRAPLNKGTDPNGISYNIGQSGGVETVTLETAQIPDHAHTLNASTATASQTGPGGGLLAAAGGVNQYAAHAPPNTTMNAQSVGAAGFSQAHNNLQPLLAVAFIISLFGIFPTQG